jgi:hypothetical protein
MVFFPFHENGAYECGKGGKVGRFELDERCVLKVNHSAPPFLGIIIHSIIPKNTPGKNTRWGF